MPGAATKDVSRWELCQAISRCCPRSDLAEAFAGQNAATGSSIARANPALVIFGRSPLTVPRTPRSRLTVIRRYRSINCYVVPITALLTQREANVVRTRRGVYG